MTIGERIRHELREVGLLTGYFLACFLVFLTLKKLLLSQYGVEITVLGQAVVGALVVAKVVVILDATPLGKRARPGRRIVRVLERSLVYTAFVFVATLAEHLFHAYRETGALSSAVSELWSVRDPHHFLALNLSVGLSLLAYNAFSEIDGQLGEGGLRRFFFAR